jgi:hypothetical protein
MQTLLISFLYTFGIMTRQKPPLNSAEETLDQLLDYSRQRAKNWSPLRGIERLQVDIAKSLEQKNGSDKTPWSDIASFDERRS